MARIASRDRPLWCGALRGPDGCLAPQFRSLHAAHDWISALPHHSSWSFLSWRMGIVDREGLPVHLLPRATVVCTVALQRDLQGKRRRREAGFDSVRARYQPAHLRHRGHPAKRSRARHLRQLHHSHTGYGVDRGPRFAYITVHAIAEDVADGLQEGEMDRRVTWLEGEGP